MRGEYLKIVKQNSEKKLLSEEVQEPKAYADYFAGWVVSKLSIDPMALKDETIETIVDEFIGEMSAIVGPEIEEAELNTAELKTIVSNYTQKAMEANGGEEGEEKEEGEKTEAPKAEEKPEPKAAPAKKENPFAKKDEKAEEGEEEEEEGKEKAPKASFAPKAPKAPSTKTECATSIKAPKPIKLTSEVKGPKPYKK